MPENIKCAECGFLAVRKIDTREIMDAEEPLRRKGELPLMSGNRGYVYDEWPVCFVRKTNFRTELEDNSGVPHRHRVLNQDRECDGFTPWQQGFTPKEHADMLQEKERLHWQARREDDDRRWREEQEIKADARHKEAITAARRISLVSALIGFVAGLAAVALAGVLASNT